MGRRIQLFDQPLRGPSSYSLIAVRVHASNCDNARAEGFFGVLKEEFYNGRDWSRTTPDQFVAKLRDYLDWYVNGRLRAFVKGGRTVYDTIAGRRRRLGYEF